VLIGLFPELDAPGGVQRAGKHVASVMTEFAAIRGMECRILSLNEGPELKRLKVAEREIVFTGSERAKGRFLMTAIRTARRPVSKGKSKIKLVVAGHPNLAPVVRAMRFAAPRVKSIICTHGVEVWEPLPRLRRMALRSANVVLAPSKYTAEQVATVQGVAPEKIHVLPWALDPQFEALAPQAAKSLAPANFPEGRVVLTVGRWRADERYKGMDTLITALPRLLPRFPELQLAAVGDGDDRAWLEDLAEETGVERHVHFLSGLSYAELAACYAHCEMFALPSKGEGFGLVYLEAMACGKPVIGGAHGGAPEVIDDGKTGYLVPHGDAAQLATAIETLLADPALEQEMGRRGKQRVANDFRFNVFAK
jgi:glycosyltransferase involved in cell wall biosynthesis